MFENISGYVHHAFGTLCVMPTRQTYFPERMGTEVQLITDRMLTFSLRLAWLRKYVISIPYRSSAADILTTIGLAQGVRDSIPYRSSAARLSQTDIHCSDCKQYSNRLLIAAPLTTAICFDIQRPSVIAVPTAYCHKCSFSCCTSAL